MVWKAIAGLHRPQISTPPNSSALNWKCKLQAKDLPLNISASLISLMLPWLMFRFSPVPKPCGKPSQRNRGCSTSKIRCSTIYMTVIMVCLRTFGNVWYIITTLQELHPPHLHSIHLLLISL